MLQCGAVWCSVVQYAAVCCTVLQYVEVCCNVLQYAALCCSVLCTFNEAISEVLRCAMQTNSHIVILAR